MGINIHVNVQRMDYSIVYYNKTLQDSLCSWPGGIRASFIRVLERIVSEGPDLGLPYTRAMGQGLFEIRARGPEGIGRVFFCALIGRRIVLLHSFIKKSERTPERELMIARKRSKEVKNG